MYFFEFKMPGKIICVDGGASRLGSPLDRMGCKRVMIVTDEGVRSAGLIDPVTEGIEKGNARVAGVFDSVPSDPDVATAEAGAAMARVLGVDGLVSVGGGSSIDTAKATLILLCETGNLLEYEWNEYFASMPPLPHIAVPTTAGTGSESTHVAMITDKSRHRKMMYIGADLLPRAAVLDPSMTLGLPPHLTAATGMDALTHAIEALHTIWHQPLTDGLAMQTVELVDTYIERVFTDGSDVFGRMNMLLAASMGGIVAANSFIAIVHAAAHPIGALFHVHHGVAVAVMLPYAMEMNLAYEGIPAQYRKAASALGLKIDNDDDMTASRRAIERIREMQANLALPARLRDIGITADDLAALVDEIMEDKAMLVTPGNPGREDIVRLVNEAF